MKKRILLGLIGALLLANMLVTSANAQTFVASFGVTHHWRVPMIVSHYIDDHYYNYNWVHTRRIAHHGSIEYEVTLQHGDIFVDVTIDTFGRVFRTVRRDYYPLHDHVCGSYCGYHPNYYEAYYSGCNSHSHNGHNHVNYYNRPSGYAYGYYKNYGHNNHKSHKNSHGNYKKQKGYQNEYNNDRKAHSNTYPTRRGEYHKEASSGSRNNNRISSDSYTSRGNSSNKNGQSSRKSTTASRRNR